MPLPTEQLESIRLALEGAEVQVKSIEDVIADLRASGIDASKQEEALTSAKENIRQLRLFYGRQSKRPPS